MAIRQGSHKTAHPNAFAGHLQPRRGCVLGRLPVVPAQKDRPRPAGAATGWVPARFGWPAHAYRCESQVRWLPCSEDAQAVMLGEVLVVLQVERCEGDVVGKAAGGDPHVAFLGPRQVSAAPCPSDAPGLRSCRWPGEPGGVRMVRRRSTVRFRKGSPGQGLDSHAEPRTSLLRGANRGAVPGIAGLSPHREEV
jgi:hypothetical protein